MSVLLIKNKTKNKGKSLKKMFFSEFLSQKKHKKLMKLCIKMGDPNK